MLIQIYKLIKDGFSAVNERDSYLMAKNQSLTEIQDDKVKQAILEAQKQVHDTYCALDKDTNTILSEVKDLVYQSRKSNPEPRAEEIIEAVASPEISKVQSPSLQAEKSGNDSYEMLTEKL